MTSADESRLATRDAAPVAVIGLGLMGGAMAANLFAAGHRVLGYDPDPAARQLAASRGVDLLDAVSGIPADIGLILTSLPSGDSLHETVASLSARPRSHCVLAEMSTLSLEDKSRARASLAGIGIDMLDCPISGTGAQAVLADLSIYASGEQDAWDRVAAIFAAFAQRPRYVGPFGAGTRLKYIANLLVAIHNVSTAEALALAEAAGVDLTTAVEVLREGAGNSRIFELRAPMMAQRTYLPATMKLEVWNKDMDLIHAFARELDVRTPLFDASRPVYDAARSRMPGLDTAGVFEVVRRNTAGGGNQ